MTFLDFFILAVGLSMDAFAVAVCLGLGMERVSVRKRAIVGAYFGIFQGGMPLIGYYAGRLFAGLIAKYDHWIAFTLLVFLGGKMIVASIKSADEECEEIPLTPRNMIPLATATSIDALIIGVSLAFLHVRIIPAVSFIGAMTFTLSAIGVGIGKAFGLKFKSKAEIAGGAILVLMGVKILLEHTGIFIV